MHVIPAFSIFGGDEACTRPSSRSNSSKPRITAPADRSTASAVLAAGGGTARLLAEAGSCLASSCAGAEAESIGSELLRRPRGRAIQARRSVDVSVSPYLFRAHTTKYRKKIQKIEHDITVRRSRKIARDQGQTNRPTYQRLHVWTRELSSLTREIREIRHGASRPDPHETRDSRVSRNVASRVGSGQELSLIHI